MKLWCVDYSNHFNGSIRSELFFSEVAASAFYDGCNERDYRKMYQVTDIWNYVPRNFAQFLTYACARWSDGDGDTWNRDVEDKSLVDFIEAVGAEYGMTIEVEEIEVPNTGRGVLDVDWVWDREFHHYHEILRMVK